MAEGGFDPDNTNPFDTHGGDDDDGDGDKIPLIPFEKEEPPVIRTSTSTPKSSSSHHYNPSFVDETPSGVIRDREVFQDIAADEIKEHFPNTDTSKYFAKMENGIVYVKIKGGTKNIWHKILSKDGDVLIDRNKKLPKTLRNALGQTAEEIMTERITRAGGKCLFGGSS